MKLNYRKDIDGLRAIAIIGVLIFHTDLSLLRGGFVGVDVFFVISGYLIGSILLRELESTGRVDFASFWARRTRRLLPMALVVIGITLLVAYFTMSQLYLNSVAKDAVWGALYVINWTKLASSIQYFDDLGASGPLMHYWSLAIEEQFYLLMTIVFLSAIYWKSFFSKEVDSCPVSLIVKSVLILTVLSFVANLVSISIAQPISFFGTHSRFWQLGVGVLIAYSELKKVSPNNSVRFVSQAVGLGSLLFAYFSFSSDLSYPGLFAVLPTLGAAMVIFSGVNNDHRFKSIISKLLSARPMVFLGLLSYSMYLWHWPIFVFYQLHFSSWSLADVAYVMILTLILSFVGYKVIENPVRFSNYLATRVWVNIFSAFLLTLIVSGGSYYLIQIVDKDNFIALKNGSFVEVKSVKRDLPSLYRSDPRCHISQGAIDYPDCTFGAKTSHEKVMLFGDSHAAQWFPPLEEVALSREFKLVSRTKSACVSIDVRQWHVKWKRPYKECVEWRDKVLQEIDDIKPSLVVLANSSRVALIDNQNKPIVDRQRLTELAAAEQRVVDRILQSGAEVVLIHDTPWHEFDPLECLVEVKGDSPKCTSPVSSAIRDSSPWSTSVQKYGAKVRIVNLTDQFCDAERCYTANDKFVISRDKDHVTQKFSRHLASILEDRMFSDRTD